MNEINKSLLIFCLGILFLGCYSSKISVPKNESSFYTSKSYLFLGDSFANQYNSKIDSTNFTWRDSFIDNLHVYREYPKYQGQFRRIENFEYYQNGKPSKTLIETFYKYGNTIDSTVYNNIDLETTEITKFITGENPFKEIHKTSNDTLYIDQIINGKYGFTSREFWETKSRKQRQIIKPTLGEVMNTFVHNDKGDLIIIERYENGEFVYKTMAINYEYDSQNRITLKETYYLDADEKILGSTEIIIYNK